ncbi:glycosyltransferase [Ruegeria sp. 2205SS24-7]|uniref:glycosyltransferase n=1 Tax=Ruegeria discodermiae TaxID=3064389 RepID=UPI002740A37A|nr:glycosyltransferase [Ruegeria sp. 2205SS24-7]MDP5220752.1 glycosyltransferase [Ruegeria sp. 2205SS24-7]
MAGRLVAVVVTHNRLAKLQPTLSHLQMAGPAHLSAIVVVDNACSDGTADWLSTCSDPRLHVVTSAENLGGAGGFEMGMRHAVQYLNPDWLVVMDDDAYPDPVTLARFHALPRAQDTAYAAAVYFPDGHICEMNRPSCNPFWSPTRFLRTLTRGRDGYHIPRSAYDVEAPCPIDLTSFVGLFLSRQIVEDTGYPDPGLFLYGDDVIYTLTLRRRGWKILFDPALRFEHDFSTFEAQGPQTIRPLWKVYYFCRNRLLMYRAAAPLLFWLLLPMLGLKWHLAGRRYGADKPLYLHLLRRALRDAAARDTDLSHGEVLALAGGPLSGSECPDGSGPAGSDPSAKSTG